MDYNAILNAAKSWINDYISRCGSENYCFHDLVHTTDVVNATTLMASHYDLSERDRFIVLIAAYFHDVGYFTGGAAGHEERSAEQAADFLKEHGVELDIIAAVRGCILATKMPQQPQNLIERIVCDADFFHLGTDRFEERNGMMQREYSRTQNEVECESWRKQTLELLENHEYHTEYAKQLLDEQKRRHIDLLKQGEPMGAVALPADNSGAGVSGAKKKKKGKNARPDRGIETMFRVTSTNNQRLSDMADNKANILLTVNSIILSVIIAVLVRKLNDNEHLVIPTFILLLVSLATIVVAILATRPKIPAGIFTQQEVDNKDVNLLFFGNFYRMGLPEYAASMRKVMEDRDFLYGTLTKDVYSQGVVL